MSIYGEEAGIPQTVLMRTYGHSDEAMTRRYQTSRAAMSLEQAEEIEQAMYAERADRSEVKKSA